ncbi:MAG: hypothetical protein C0608_04300 [Deltaproteobacteria bacterium]|nr:MAG: hypothetical protein C0608_04300 [Deltaproteobacteria bacterium]
MKLLLHACCGPCSIAPLRLLGEEGIEAFTFYFNPNIHPYREWAKRREALTEHVSRVGVRELPAPEYEVRGWFREVVYREERRCRLCYRMRLFETARRAKKGRFDGFTTTLLYSRYQNHEAVIEAGESVAEELDIPFIYRDWRENWEEGVERSRELGIYRQEYCGCLYSEVERFRPRAVKGSG